MWGNVCEADKGDGASAGGGEADGVGWGIVSLGRLDTVRGTVTLGWEYKDGRFEYTVTLPEGIKATYNGIELTQGENKCIIDEKGEIK